MSLLRYADECSAIGRQLQELLIGDEYEDVFDEIGKFSYREWHQWRREHQQEIERLACATPARQKKLLEKVDQKKKLLLVFAAVQVCLEASELIEFVVTRCQEGLGYRDMVKAATLARNEINSRPKSYWPWGGDPSYRKDS